MKVTVLFGGPSAERTVSLVSGRAVIEGLKAAGHDVFASDISPSDLECLKRPTDVVFPVLHGAWGESGELQEILENRGLPFVGSGSTASRLGMDKMAAKQAWEKAGLSTPQWRMVNSPSAAPPISGPCVVKPIDSGSSIDVFVCKNPADCEAQAASAISTVVGKYGRALVEKYIAGPELTVGLFEEKALSPIRIIAKSEFFDYQAKYSSSETEHRFDTGLPIELVNQCRELARQANNVIGARDLGRVDIMIDQQTSQPYLLEINTMPGFTPRSLLPEAAAKDGVPFSRLVDRLVCRAYARGAQVRRAAV